jgi:hypothetical protein
MLSRKYLANQVLAQAKMGPGCSHFWQSLMSVNDIFQQHSERVMLGGEKTLFWEDKWVNNYFPDYINYLSRKGLQ